MSDLKKLILESLKDINQGYEIAETDLTEVLLQVTDAVQEATGAPFDFSYHSVFETPSESVFRVLLDFDRNEIDSETHKVSDIKITPMGYPIYFGNFNRSAELFMPQATLDDRKALETHFFSMLSDPNSSLVQAIGFGLRKRKRVRGY